MKRKNLRGKEMEQEMGDSTPESFDLEEVQKCPKCGFTYEWNGKMCEHCGYDELWSEDCQPNDKCEICHQGNSALQKYRFYYGRTANVDIRLDGPTQTTTTQYNMAPMYISACICDGCIRVRRKRRAIGLAVIAVVGFVGAVRMSPGGISLFLYLIGLGAGFFSFTSIFKNKKEFGDSLVMGLHKRSLKREGWDTFFTREEYRSLRR